jgi:hypothetical protein
MLRDLTLTGATLISHEEAEEDIPFNTHSNISMSHNHPFNDLDDIFGSTPSSPTALSPPSPSAAQSHNGGDHSSSTHPSDVPRLRSTHVTNGYREGIATSKERFIQEGFDEGYSLGGEIGRVVGRILGILEGMSRSPLSQASVVEREIGEEDGEGKTEEVERGVKEGEVEDLLKAAREELSLVNIFGRQFFGEDGVWIYHVPSSSSSATAERDGSAQEKKGIEKEGEEGQKGAEEESDVTFEDVARAHPLVRKWADVVDGLLAR